MRGWKILEVFFWRGLGRANSAWPSHSWSSPSALTFTILKVRTGVQTILLLLFFFFLTCFYSLNFFFFFPLRLGSLNRHHHRHSHISPLAFLLLSLILHFQCLNIVHMQLISEQKKALRALIDWIQCKFLSPPPPTQCAQSIKVISADTACCLPTQSNGWGIFPSANFPKWKALWA